MTNYGTYRCMTPDYSAYNNTYQYTASQQPQVHSDIDFPQNSVVAQNAPVSNATLDFINASVRPSDDFVVQDDVSLPHSVGFVPPTQQLDLDLEAARPAFNQPAVGQNTMVNQMLQVLLMMISNLMLPMMTGQQQ